LLERVDRRSNLTTARKKFLVSTPITYK
jgi:hypothetical protein